MEGRKKALIAVATVIFIAGCATGPNHGMKRANTSPEQANRDDAECDYEADKAVVNLKGVEAGMKSAGLWKQCMRLKGYAQ
jgi:hypothetical protein